MKIAKWMATGSLLTMAFAASGQTPSVITGTATYRERMALPPDAVFEATLEDVSRADAASKVIGRARTEKPGNPPFHFSISYDPKAIVQNHTYAVRARVTEAGKLLFTSDQQYPVITRGSGNEVTMMILKHVTSSATSAPRQSSAADEPLRETYWKLIQLNGKPVTAANQQQEAHLVFRTEDSRITGSGGCNRLMGGYAVEGNAMHFKGVASTMMACAQGMETEQAFVGALNKVETWKITGKHLEMYDGSGALLARFQANALK